VSSGLFLARSIACNFALKDGNNFFRLIFKSITAKLEVLKLIKTRAGRREKNYGI